MESILNFWLAIILFIGSNFFFCTCPPPVKIEKQQKREFKESECIYIAEVTSINENEEIFEFTIIESFKSNEESEGCVGVFNKYCYPVITQKGRWLLYGNLDNNSNLIINECGLTRSFKTPERSAFAITPPPPFLDKKLSSKEKNSIMEDYREEEKIQAKVDLKTEIQFLRKQAE